MCVLCVEQQLRKWKEKIEATGEPLSKEETLKLIEIGKLHLDEVVNGSLEEKFLEALGIEKQDDCLNG